MQGHSTQWHGIMIWYKAGRWQEGCESCIFGPFIFHLNIFVCTIVGVLIVFHGWLHEPRLHLPLPCIHTHALPMVWFIVTLVYLNIKCWYEQIITATTTIKIITACFAFAVQIATSATDMCRVSKWDRTIHGMALISELCFEVFTFSICMTFLN